MSDKIEEITGTNYCYIKEPRNLRTIIYTGAHDTYNISFEVDQVSASNHHAHHGKITRSCPPPNQRFYDRAEIERETYITDKQSTLELFITGVATPLVITCDNDRELFEIYKLLKEDLRDFHRGSPS